jgi:protein tyrosine phosphatase (PTP) superfamily phosphohydrolase (DUF442 family)
MPRRPRLRAIAGLLAAALAAAVFSFRAWLFRGNLHPVIPGEVYRSAQLSAPELERLIDSLALRSVVNLRGLDREEAWYGEQERALAARGVAHHGVRLSATRLPSPQQLERLARILETAKRPLLLHCGAGTDRSGLASALALLLAGEGVERARAEFGLLHGFPGWLSGSDLPRWLDLYAAWLAARDLAHAPPAVHRFLAEDYVPYFYKASIEPVELPRVLEVDRSTTAVVRVTNRSPQPWRFRPGDVLGVHLGAQIVSLDPDRPWQRATRGETPDKSFAPGESAEIPLHLPPLPRPGRYRLTIDLVDELVAWFADMGSRPLELELEARPASAS